MFKADTFKNHSKKSKTETIEINTDQLKHLRVTIIQFVSISVKYR